MKKVILVILAGILLIGSVSAVAEYKDYRLTEGDMSADSIWGYLALDAHNTVVLSCSLKKGGWKAFLLDCRCFIGTIFSVAKGEGVVEGGTGELHRHSGPINPNDGKTVFPEDDFQVK